MGIEKLDNSIVIEGIDQITRKSLQSMELEIKPSIEQIEKDVISIKQLLINKYGKDKENIEKIKEIELIYCGFYNGELLYGLLRPSDQNLLAILNIYGDNRIHIGYTRDPYPGKNDLLGNGYRKLYNDILNQIGYKEVKGEDGIIRTYKIDEEGKIVGNEIDIKSKEYFELHCSIQELRNIIKIKWTREVKIKGERLHDSVIKDGLYFRVLTFDDIEFFKSNGNITEEQYNQAKEQIAKYYYRLVFLGIIKKSEAKDKTQEYFDKQYISKDTYDRTMKYLNDKE